MTERWPKVLSIILILILIPIMLAYAKQNIEYTALRTSYKENLHRQTQLIIDLRKELAGEHFRNFESVQDLQNWVSLWLLTKMPIALNFLNTDIVLRGEKYSEYFDCDDLSEAMQRDALRDGYILDKALVDKNGHVYGVEVTGFRNHTGVIATADNAYWYVEPQTGQITYIVRRD